MWMQTVTHTSFLYRLCYLESRNRRESREDSSYRKQCVHLDLLKIGKHRYNWKTHHRIVSKSTTRQRKFVYSRYVKSCLLLKSIRGHASLLPQFHQSNVSFSKTSKFSTMIPKRNTYFLYHHSFPSNAINLDNFLVRSAFKSDNQPGTFTYKRTQCKTRQLRSQGPIDLPNSLTTLHEFLRHT